MAGPWRRSKEFSLRQAAGEAEQAHLDSQAALHDALQRHHAEVGARVEGGGGGCGLDYESDLVWHHTPPPRRPTPQVEPLRQREAQLLHDLEVLKLQHSYALDVCALSCCMEFDALPGIQ